MPHKRQARLVLFTTLMVSALAGRASADGIVVLYPETEYRGTYLMLTADTPRLALRDFDRRAASVLLVSGVTASLYSGEYYTGSCTVVRENRGSLAGLAGGGVSSVRIGQDCVPAPTDAPKVTMYDADSEELIVSEDMPDLGGFGNRATEIQFPTGAPHAVALYSNANYLGTCETFIASQELAGTTIGASTASSIRLNYTCDGPVRSAPVITGLKVADSTDDPDNPEVTCPSGYSEEEQDLNAGTHDADDSSPGLYRW